MACTADSPADDLAGLLGHIRHRLESAHELALAAQQHLAGAATHEIEDVTARLETVAQEFKLLIEEYQRFPAEIVDAPDRGVTAALEALEQTVSRLARSSAVAGGMLERLVAVSRGRLGLLSAMKDGTYRRDGRVPELDTRGIRLKEWV